MIWNDRKIMEWGENGGVTPYNKDHINPASLDLTLGKTFRKPKKTGRYCGQKGPTKQRC